MTHDETRFEALLAAEDKALALLDEIETQGLIRAGRTEREVEQEIKALAADVFQIDKHWHKRIVRAGANTLATAGDNPKVRTISEDDMVFLDLGPVLEDWEADVGRSYVVGDDPQKHALVAELPRQFDLLAEALKADPLMTGDKLYEIACDNANAAGWLFGGEIAGHIVAEFPHARIPGRKQAHHISPDNPDPMRNMDALGRVRHWIGEIHLIAPDNSFGGFYERLLDRP